MAVSADNSMPKKYGMKPIVTILQKTGIRVNIRFIHILSAFKTNYILNYLPAVIFTALKGITPHHRIYGLDILRAIAVMLVMHVHGQHFIDAYIPYKYYWWMIFDGVDVFFVLSGFLI